MSTKTMFNEEILYFVFTKKADWIRHFLKTKLKRNKSH